MPATAADIAAYTTDGVVITSPTNSAISAAIAADNIDAQNGATSEIEMFYDNAADAQTALDERFAYLSEINPIHLGIEIEEALGMGDTIALTPQVPSFRIVDVQQDLDVVARCRGYAHDMNTDRFSVEILG